MAIEARLSDSINVAAAREAFQRDGYVRLEGFFAADLAEAVARAMEASRKWKLAYSGPGGVHLTLSPDQMSAMSPQEANAIQSGLLKQAREEFAYIYRIYPLIEAIQHEPDPADGLQNIAYFLNNTEVLDFARAVTGVQTVNRCDVQASYYAPGDFLTRHNDKSGPTDRAAAFTIGFSRRWQPDWGGLLLLMDEHDRIEAALPPAFNTLTLFKVPRWHLVTQVAGYCPAPRLSLTGWFDNGRRAS